MFDTNFEVFLADTPESKEIHYSIRYKVYCEEMGFENKSDFPMEMEFDENDDNSVHFIVRDRASSQWVGAMRLIFKQEALLPIEQSCNISEKIDLNELYGSVELSRLCLVKEVRRGFKGIESPPGIVDESSQLKETDTIKLMSNQHKFNRVIIWGLIHAAAEYCCSNNIKSWYFMTSHALGRVLNRGGLNLINIGEPCQHKGERFPFKMNALEAYQSEIWKNYNNGYQFFSSMSENQVGQTA